MPADIAPEADGAFVFPLSFAQQRLWFLDQLAPGNPFYNVHLAVPLAFSVNRSALEAALGEIVRRHESLRTTFVVVEGEPRQRIAPQLRVALEFADLSALPADECETEATRLAAAEAARPFDLAAGPLARFLLLRRGPADHVLVVTFHHSICDGWSLGIFFRELAALYPALALGRPSPLPELPIQYADFAVWQRDWLAGDLLRDQLAWWRARLADLPVLQLPTDRPRPPVASYRGAQHPLSLSPALTRAVRALSQGEGVTPFMALLAAFQAVLARYTGQHDIVVGAPVAGRNRSELEDLIGFFVNTVVLRTDLSGDPSFREILRRVREVSLGAYAHQELPFEKLVEELQPNRDLGRNPLFQVTFQLFSPPAAPASAPAAPPAATGAIAIQRSTAVFDLAFQLLDSRDAILGHVEYATDLFDASTIARLASHFQTLLAAAVADPDLRLSQLPLLSAAERRQLLLDWNATATDYPRDATIHALFAAQAARTPSAVALVHGDAFLGYRDLDERSSRLAHLLRARGVTRGSLVAICMHRSLDLVVSLLAILKAGAAYVPLDPAYPRERLRFMLEDVAAPVVLTHADLAPACGSAAAQPVHLDQLDLSPFPASPPPDDAGATDLAYVVYTSGSTGTPKGVAVPHRAVVRLVKGTTYASFGPEEVFLQFAPVSFDASTFEIWGPLLNGGRLVLFPGEVASLEELGAEIVRGRVTTLWLTSGLFDQMVDAQLESLRNVRQLLTGGEVLSPGHVSRARAALGGRLVNGYGPTENTTFSCCHEIEAVPDAAAPVPIGKPISNSQAYVLDRQRQPVPIGVWGELYLGGDGLARGYLNAPELTAERFVPNPLAGTPGERLYRTGDLARWRADGRLEFGGRMDLQVKIRGFRVELGEVEAALGQCPGVREAAALAREDVPGDRRLVAYVVPSDGTRPTAEELRTALQARLPAFMVPSTFVLLEALPLSPNGKVDRRALPSPGAWRASGAGRLVAPRTSAEQAVARLWREVLHVEQVGAFDDFFVDLGGHSLLATQLVSRVRDAFGVEIPLQRLFAGPTVAQLAVAVEDALLREIDAPPAAEHRPGVDG